MEYVELAVDFVLHIDRYLADMTVQYGAWIYVILFVIMFCETGFFFIPFLPGDSMLFVAGALAAMQSSTINVHLLAFLLIIAAILGYEVNFCIGKYLGSKMFKNPHSKIFKRSYLEMTQAFYKRHGGKTIFLARFIPIIRTFAPLVGGMGKMHYRFFLLSNIVGGVVWVSIFTYAGYLFGGLTVVRDNIQILVAAIILISIIPAVIEFAHKKRKIR